MGRCSKPHPSKVRSRKKRYRGSQVKAVVTSVTSSEDNNTATYVEASIAISRVVGSDIPISVEDIAQSDSGFLSFQESQLTSTPLRKHSSSNIITNTCEEDKRANESVPPPLNDTDFSIIEAGFSVNENLPDLLVEYGSPHPNQDANVQKLEGRRVVDIRHFVNQVRSLERHKCSRNTSGSFKLSHEKIHGFYSNFTFECPYCHQIQVITTDPVPLNKQDSAKNLTVNDAAVWGTVSIGGGHANLDELFSVIGVPVMSKKTFSKSEEKLGEKWESILYEEMISAGKEEKRMAEEAGDVYQGVPFITVIIDGGWSHRSHGHRYSANSGVAIIIGKRSKKILYIGIRNKYCAMCDFHERREQVPKSHKCFKNWNGPSASMEADILVDGFKHSEVMHGIQYREFIGDGDSSVYKKILESVSYGPQVSKIECTNHAVKNLTKQLYKHSATSAEYKRVLNPGRIRQMTKGAKGAIYHAAKNKGTVQDLVTDLKNIPKHVFGNHTHCRTYFCKKIQGINHTHTIPRDLFIKIMSAINNLSAKAHRLIKNDTSNAAENYMSLVAKFTGGKQINRGKKASFQRRCYAAGLCQHLGRSWYHHTWKKITTISPNKFLKKHIAKKQKELASWRKFVEKDKSGGKKYKIQKNISQELIAGQADYGPSCQQPDMNLEEYERRKLETIKNLTVNTEIQVEVEKETRGQASNDRWMRERRNRLTASNFGEICKRKKTTSCRTLVKRLLYTPPVNTPAMQYGKTNEEVAIADYQKKTGTIVRKCGIFVSLEHFYLAASPDGLIDEDGLIEVKCPKSIESMTPLEATERVKNFCCTNKNNSLLLKTTDKYYYQVQGQLNIAQKNFCDFIVWSPKGVECQRINRDKRFWSEKMLPFLERFYFHCLLPELIDPRVPRNMEIREPYYITEAIEEKKKQDEVKGEKKRKREEVFEQKKRSCGDSEKGLTITSKSNRSVAQPEFRLGRRVHHKK